MKNYLLVFALLFSFASASFAQSDKAYAKSLKAMFEVSGAEESYQSVIQQMFGMYREMYPNVEEEVWNGLEKEFSKTSMDDLTEMLVPVYKKYMSKDDLEELIEFYKSPIGIKLATSTPLIMVESMEVGQAWGMKIGQDFEQRMKEKGY